jgi:hypothetical protein
MSAFLIVTPDFGRWDTEAVPCVSCACLSVRQVPTNHLPLRRFGMHPKILQDNLFKFVYGP